MLERVAQILITNLVDDLSSIKDIENQIQNSLKRVTAIVISQFQFIALLVDMEMYVKTTGSESQRIVLNVFLGDFM